MFSFVRIFLLLPALVLASAALHAKEPLTIRVEAKGWGNADPRDVQKVLESAGHELLRHIPPERTIKIRAIAVVDAPPQVDYRRAKDGEFTVRLAVRDRLWARFAFQFGHEMGHIVCHYERRYDNKAGTENLWFEESVCEAASLFVLTRMAETWKETPPFPSWKPYAPDLADYAAKRAKGADVPKREAMAAWFADNRAALRADPVLRERNLVVAVHLSEMLQRTPEHWGAFPYLNLGRPDPANTFESYLENWYFSAPPIHKPFVKGVADMLGVKSKSIAEHAGK